MPRHESLTRWDENSETWTIYLSRLKTPEQLEMGVISPLRENSVLDVISKKKKRIKQNPTFIRCEKRKTKNIFAAYEGKAQIEQQERGYFAQHLKPVMGTFSGALGTGMLLWSTLSNRNDREENEAASLDWIWWLTTLSGIGFTLLGAVTVIVATRQKHKEKNEKQMSDVIETHLEFLENVKEELELKLRVIDNLIKLVARGGGIHKSTEFRVDDKTKKQLNKLFVKELEKKHELSVYENLDNFLNRAGIYKRTLLELIKAKLGKTIIDNLPKNWENLNTFEKLLQAIEKLSDTNVRRTLFYSFAKNIVMLLEDPNKLKAIYSLTTLLQKNFALEFENDALRNYVASSEALIVSEVDKSLSGMSDKSLAPFQDVIVFLKDVNNLNDLQLLIKRIAQSSMKDYPEKMLAQILEGLSNMVYSGAEAALTSRKGMTC